MSSKQKTQVSTCKKCAGSRIILTEKKIVSCSDCKGKGRNPKNTYESCAGCRGSGKVEAEYYSRCPNCRG